MSYLIAPHAHGDITVRRQLAFERAIHEHYLESTHGLTANMRWTDERLKRRIDALGLAPEARQREKQTAATPANRPR